MKNKKAVHPVIATALLIVVAVITLVLFNSWFQTYSSNLMADVEIQSSINAIPEIETVIGDFVYIKTPTNLTIDRLLVNGDECDTNISLSSGMQGVNISSCLSGLSSSIPKITLITDNNIVTESIYLKDAVVSNSNLNIVETDGNFNLLSNGVVDCKGASFGEIGELAGKNYTAVSNHNLSDMIGSNNISFYETACTSLVIDMNVDDLWNGGVFYNLNINPNISHWDTSSVTDMAYMFSRSCNFDNSIDNFDTSSVINMRGMFYDASSFNQPLNFDTSSVTDMESMFSGASSFNQPLNFDTSSVTSMAYMFLDAISFNQSLDFDTSSVTYMESMFSGASSFNQPLNFDTSSVNQMAFMFSGATSFNQPLNFDTSNIIFPNNMMSMFNGASSFNQDLRDWCVFRFSSDPFNFASSSPLNTNGMKPIWGSDCEYKEDFSYVSSLDFNYDLDGRLICDNANPNDFTNISGIYYYAVSNTNIKLFVSGKGYINNSGEIIYFNSSNICTSHITDMSDIFVNMVDFNQPLNHWDVSSVINMESMFQSASNFNQPLDNWNVSNVESMRSMFSSASNFNQDLSNWDVSSVTDMGSIFRYSTNFNQDISNWDVSSVNNMFNMFQYASNFNQDISNWNVSNVTTMTQMFQYAINFNQSLDSWDVSSVTNMVNMFQNANNFNQPLNSWDLSSATDIGWMFQNANNFNQPLNNWNTSSVTSMSWMFNNAINFNQNISSWCVNLIPTIPAGFDTNSGFVGQTAIQPQWGQPCP